MQSNTKVKRKKWEKIFHNKKSREESRGKFSIIHNFSMFIFPQRCPARHGQKMRSCFFCRDELRKLLRLSSRCTLRGFGEAKSGAEWLMECDAICSASRFASQRWKCLFDFATLHAKLCAVQAVTESTSDIVFEREASTQTAISEGDERIMSSVIIQQAASKIAVDRSRAI